MTGYALAARRAAPALAALGAGVVVLYLGADFVRALLQSGSVHARTSDFFGTIWQPGRQILAGRSPYPAPDPVALARAIRPSVYPPALLVAAAPLAYLPAALATVLWNVLGVAALVAALWLAGLRDARCYAVALLFGPQYESLALAQVNGLLALGLAVTWRYRRRLGAPAGAVAALVAAKLFLWPLGLWLLARRSYRAALLAAAACAAVTGAAWAVIGFAGLHEYPALVAADATAFQAKSASLVALAMTLGAGAGAARLAAGLVGAALLAAVVLVARREDGDWRAFVLAIAAAFALSPILWRHYLVLILVPLAVARPRLDRLWIAFVLLAAVPLSESQPPLRLLVTVAAYAVPLAVLATAARAGRPARLAAALRRAA